MIYHLCEKEKREKKKEASLSREPLSFSSFFSSDDLALNNSCPFLKLKKKEK